jgi:hypothetical protein
MGRARAGVLRSLVVAASLVAGCSTAGGPSATATPAHAIVTFEVEGDERFKVELTTADLVAQAEALLAGQDVPGIPVGTVIRGDPGPNAPWSWHLDSASIRFADATIEGCDALPSEVESGDLDGDRYCPWSATVVAVDGAP